MTRMKDKTMIEITMEDIYPFYEETIDELIPPDTIGNYILGYRVGKSEIQIRYVGRSDTDLNRRLHEHLEDPYDAFMFNTQNTPEEAYIEECWNWHGCDGPQGRLENKIHPDKPEGCEATCPVCGR